jgi:hypothetical protein
LNYPGEIIDSPISQEPSTVTYCIKAIWIQSSVMTISLPKRKSGVKQFKADASEAVLTRNGGQLYSSSPFLLLFFWRNVLFVGVLHPSTNSFGHLPK